MVTDFQGLCQRLAPEPLLSVDAIILDNFRLGFSFSGLSRKSFHWATTKLDSTMFLSIATTQVVLVFGIVVKDVAKSLCHKYQQREMRASKGEQHVAFLLVSPAFVNFYLWPQFITLQRYYHHHHALDCSRRGHSLQIGCGLHSSENKTTLLIALQLNTLPLTGWPNGSYPAQSPLFRPKDDPNYCYYNIIIGYASCVRKKLLFFPNCHASGKTSFSKNWHVSGILYLKDNVMCQEKNI